MTQIQASVSVKDDVDSKIEQKIKAIGVASVTTTNQLNALKNAVNSLSSKNINGFSNAVASLGRVNFNGLANQIRQLSQVSSQLNGSFSQTALQITKLQIAQTKLQQEQTKASILTVRLQREQQALANAQNQGAISANNLANAQARANTAQTRSQIASIQAQTATTRLAREQARLEQQLQRNANISTQANIGLRQFVGTMFALSSTGATLAGIAQLGDQYQSMINKLTLVTNSAEEARNRLATLTDVAKNSYSDLESVTKLYTRLDMAVKQMGGSSSEAIQITQTLTKTVSLAGLTTAEASSALLQISQAFNKGKLDGDEFRTVMETMPPLADALATKLKTNRGELLKLAPLGKITGDVLKQAVIEMSEVVDQKFAKMTPTVAMHLQNLQTEAQTYFGAMFKDTGLAETFGNAIKYISNNLELATRLAVGFGVAIAGAMVLKTASSFLTTIDAIKKAWIGATGAVEAFNLVTKATPIGWLVAGVSALAIGMDLLFDAGLGKSLFPSYDQDKAKMDDYFSRLKDINTQMDLMSFTKLTQESAILDKNMAENSKHIDEVKKEIAKLEKQTSNYEQVISNTSKTIAMYGDKEKAVVQIYSMGSTGLDELTVAEIQNSKAQENSIQTKATLAEKQRELEELQGNYEQGLRSELKIQLELIERIKDAGKAIEDKREADIKANEQLSAQNAIYEKGKELLPQLEARVKALREELQRLVGMNADLSAPVNETAKQKTNDLMDKTEARIREQIAKQNEWAKATPERQLEMKVADQHKKDLELFKNSGDPEKVKLGEQLLAGLVKAEQAVENRKKADAEAQQSARKHARETENLAKKRESEHQKAIEKQEQYVGKLNDELALLKEGYQNYSKYNSLYSLRLELQQKGVSLTEQQMTAIKSKIDAVEREKELAKEINTYEENSLKRQREQQQLKLNALSKANVSETDRRIEYDKTLSNMGVTASLDQGITGITEQYRLHYEAIDQMRISDQEKETARNALRRQENEDVFQQYVNNMKQMGGMWEVLGNTIETFEQGATTAITNVLTGTSSISDAMRSLANTILNEVVNSFVKIGVRWALSQATMLAQGKANQATATADAVASGTAITSAMTPAATATAIATQGASVGAGMTALMGAFMAIPMLIALAGKRKDGGTVNAGSLYQVGEGNAPEIYRSRSGRQYMIAGDNGRVFSNKQVMGNGGGNVVHVTQNVTINGNGNIDANTLSEFRNQTRSVIYEVLANEQRDAGGMLA